MLFGGQGFWNSTCSTKIQKEKKNEFSSAGLV